MNHVLLGATAMGAICISLFFVRFWQRTRDVFHLLFALSFLLLAVQRVALVELEVPNEAFPALYLPRLAAYLLIIVAVLQKNFRKRAA